MKPLRAECSTGPTTLLWWLQQAAQPIPAVALGACGQQLSVKLSPPRNGLPPQLRPRRDGEKLEPGNWGVRPQMRELGCEASFLGTWLHRGLS